MSGVANPFDNQPYSDNVWRGPDDQKALLGLYPASIRSIDQPYSDNIRRSQSITLDRSISLTVRRSQNITLDRPTSLTVRHSQSITLDKSTSLTRTMSDVANPLII